ncbi:MAG: hypothetical protein J6T22_13690 [Bacteroidales bacterium]|nr:hypothetical protein [Bacteroidales bacterium]
MQKILVTVMALVLTVSVQAQIIIDLTKENSVVVPLDNRIERIDTLVLQRDDVNIQSIPNANLLVNDSLVMLGAMDGAVFRIKDGSLVRRMNEQPFHQSQMTGEPAVHPGSALLDSSGQFCYAWGNAIVGGSRINFIKKMDFATGETLDSINVSSADFSLSMDDSLRVATGHDYLTCFPEYKVTLPENGRIARIRYFGGSKMWIKLFRKGKIEDYICNVDGTEVERVERLTCQGQDIEPNSVIGFAWDKLASVVSTDTEFIIYVYHLKSE